MRPHRWLPLLALPALIALALVAFQASAEPLEQGVSNDFCLDCHGKPGLSMTLGDGEALPLFIDPQTFAESIHGRLGYACVQCHTSLRDYPHPPFSATDRRDLAIQLYTACQRCHSGEYERTLDSVHDRARAAGNREAAICTDCHGAHNTRQLTDPETGEILPSARTHIPETCARCHNAIYQKYLTSVHGSALTGEGNPDVPTCIDCHGVHNIEDPTTAFFRLKSPNICANCHTDPDRMAKYGISTQVLATYVADFHGTTVTLFEKQSPDAETNKPVCFDCHGVHDIKRTDDPEKGLQVRENLLSRCQECHPEATANFPDAWLSHYIPSPEHNPIVYYVNQFYKFFIPSVLGGMAILVAFDLSWRIRKRLTEEEGRRTRRGEVTPTPASASSDPHPEAVSTSGAESPAAEEKDGDRSPDDEGTSNPQHPPDRRGDGTAGGDLPADAGREGRGEANHG